MSDTHLRECALGKDTVSRRLARFDKVDVMEHDNVHEQTSLSACTVSDND